MITATRASSISPSAAILPGAPAPIFLAGGTGYIGQRLATALSQRGHRVHVLARPQSLRKVDPAHTAVAGDALDARSLASAIPEGAVVVHLVGTPHPGPGKEALFESVDLASVRALAESLRTVRVSHVVYVSVAHPAPVMRAYVAARQRGEELLRGSDVPLTVLRPWYVLGPGHRWPVMLRPLYWLWERLPSTRETARRLGLVSLAQMVRALVHAVEHPSDGWVLDVPAIRRIAAGASADRA